MVPNKLAGRYRIEREIARGGMAAVWLAVDEVLGRPVAIKILHTHLAQDVAFRERFHAEALAAAALTHPNIVSIFDTGEHDDQPFIVMEYLQGGTLQDRLDRSGVLDPGFVASMGGQICSALAAAHLAGVIHRDIKPGNILMTPTEHPKVTDFGIAKAAFLSSDLTSTGLLLGTIRYLSPEQIQGHEPDPRSDLYSLGILLYEAVTGVHPFTGQTDLQIALARVGATPRPPRDVRPDVPRDLDRAIMRALEPIEARYKDAISMREMLETPATTTLTRLPDPPSPTAVDVGDTSFVKSEGRLLFQVLIVLVAAGLLVFGVAQLSQEGRPLEALGGLIERVTNPEGRTAQIAAATAYDPRSEGGDGAENDEEAALAFDGDDQTYWSTNWYTTEKFGGLKDGVGIFVDFGEPMELAAIEVVTVTPGWTASIRTSDNGQTWSALGGSQSVHAEEFRFEVTGTSRYWMIWITGLVQTSGEGSAELPYAVAINEIRPIVP